jgi:nucleoid-associated protein YgaU
MPKATKAKPAEPVAQADTKPVKPEANLKIIAYRDPKSKTVDEKDTFVVDFNPSTFTVSSKVEYKKTEGKGNGGSDPQFDKIPPLEFSIEFTIDGTGVADKNASGVSPKDYLKNQVIKLREVTGCNINGDLHRPYYLAVLWGTFLIECVLTAMTVTYTLFDKDGVPLRAKANCSFLERFGPGKTDRKTRLESPDLTKYLTFKAGDSLPLLVKDKYYDPAYYIQVAKINKLKNFRNIPLGKQLILPPMKDYNED